MGQTIYTADIGKERIQALVDGPLATLADHVRSVGDDVVLDEVAVDRLREQYDVLAAAPGSLDGYVDHRNTMWINGEGYGLDPYDVDLLWTARIDGPVEPDAWGVVEAPHLVFDHTADPAGLAQVLADDEEDRDAPFRVLVWHGVGDSGDPAGICNVDDEDGS